MKALLDTSVLVSALIRSHSFHSRAQPVLDRAHKGEFDFFVAQHTTAELYRVLTSIPLKPSLRTEQVRELIDENVFNKASIVTLAPQEYQLIIRKQSGLGNRTGSIFDALIAFSAEKAGIDHLYTFNPTHFLRVWPEGASKIAVP